MIPFAVARELKIAGFTSRSTHNARYFLNEHLMLNRDDAARMWYADRAKRNWELKLDEELVYCPTMSELIDGCGLPFSLTSETSGRWFARTTVLAEMAVGEGATPAEAVARLWLMLHKKI